MADILRLAASSTGLAVAVLLALTCWNSLAEAACTGSGQTWNCASGTTSAEVQSAINSAADGATIAFAPGSYSWTSGIAFSMTKGVTLTCAAQGACAVTGGGVVGMNGSCAGTSSKLYRVSGFAFSGSNSPRFWFYGNNACTLTQIRIDHNSFSGVADTATIMYFGEQSSRDNFFNGVVDNLSRSAAQRTEFPTIWMCRNRGQSLL
jgi:hypothetical protein